MKAAQGRPQAFNLFTGNRPAPVGRRKRLMPGKRKPPPLSFTALTCQFAPENRNLTAGKVTRYTGGMAELTLSDGTAKRICLMRRLHGDPATAPAGDLADLADADYDAADLALGPEGEQTTDKGHEKTITTER